MGPHFCFHVSEIASMGRDRFDRELPDEPHEFGTMKVTVEGSSVIIHPD